MIESGCNLQLYSVNNITTGTDSQGEVTVRIDQKGTDRQWSGCGHGYRDGFGEGVHQCIKQSV